MHRHLRSTARTLLALAFAATWGCSSSFQAPTAPEGTTGSRSSVARWLPEQGASAPDTSGGPTTTEADTIHTVISPVRGEAGAVLTAGGVQLRIPPGALSADATIMMKARPNGRGVELHIYPESLNHFLIPLELRTDLTGMSPSARAASGWFWIDDDSGDWLLLESSTVDPETGVLSAPLQHFSKYEVGNRNLGKAGW